MASPWEKYAELIKTEMKKVYSETVVEHSIEPGEDYYRLALRSFHPPGGWITRCMCQKYWKGKG